MSRTRWLTALLGAGAMVVLAAASARPLPGQATGTIRGTVRNADDNAPIGGARVSVEALRMAALTNADGRYELRNVPAGPQSVTARFIGFGLEMREGLSNPGQTTVADFRMRAQALMMSEVVITGVSEATSRAKLPFTVAKVTTDAIPVPPTVALGSIKGRVAGVNLITGGQPGDSSTVVLRSPTSIFKSSSPLIVVDGAILTESSVDISSQDIESVEVIKGAAAASLYGSRAASGVIQIRTNRGSQIQEGRTRLIVRSEYGTNAIMKPIEWARHHNLRMNATQTAYQTAGGLDTLERQFAAPSRVLFPGQP